MTQLTQGSDVEEQLRKDLDDWAVRHMIQVPARAMQQGCDEELRAIIEAYKQRSIDRAEIEARIDEWNWIQENIPYDDMALYTARARNRIAELERQLSPTTTEDKDTKR